MWLHSCFLFLRLLPLLIVLLGGSALGLHADSSAQVDSGVDSSMRVRGLLSLDYENDANFNSLVDRYYTAGVGLRYVSREFVALPSPCAPHGSSSPLTSNPPKSPESISKTARFLRVLSAQGLIALARSRTKSAYQTPDSTPLDSNPIDSTPLAPTPCTSASPALFSAFGIALTQEMYAPKDRFSAIPPADDHPYGGALYLQLSAFNRSAYVFERLSLDLGLVGKAALAKQTQDLIHDLTHNARLAGWDTQLRNEFIANLSYGVSASIPQIYRHSAHWLDCMPQFSLALGNARIHAQASLLLRFGYHLHANTAPYLINSGFIAPPSTNSSGFSLYGFAGAGARVVGRNMFLQGNSFAPHFATPHAINMQPVIGEFVWGGVLEWGRFFGSYVVVHRSREFATQDGFASFAGITLGAKI